VKTEGILGLFRGIGPTIIGVAPHKYVFVCSWHVVCNGMGSIYCSSLIQYVCTLNIHLSCRRIFYLCKPQFSLVLCYCWHSAHKTVCQLSTENLWGIVGWVSQLGHQPIQVFSRSQPLKQRWRWLLILFVEKLLLTLFCMYIRLTDLDYMPMYSIFIY